ncbi:uncharacterized protein LOC118417558 [Branchiostoma floridae]|uniref:Uncharacterized protein LOC118417558 n=1 Tax=Branchiostoma floridae TaxID=7739 RepID=A0A9J7LA58_BRAFL|nr:uncharacterized protein LOC118417558 [Branchiostoma floridae]
MAYPPPQKPVGIVYCEAHLAGGFDLHVPRCIVKVLLQSSVGQHDTSLRSKTSFCGTFPGLVDLLTAQTTSDVEQFWVLFQWVQREGRRQQPRKSLPGDSPFEFLRAVKDGKRSYADLYQKLCSTADLKCKTVTGLCKSTGNQAGRPSGERGNVTFKSSSWNVVTINGRRALVDCQFELNFDPDRMPPCYFLSLPTHFATTHFPDDRSLQLLQGSVTLAQFRSHDTCLKSSARGKVAAEGSPVRKKAKRDEPKEERKTSEAESRKDPDSDPIMTLDELKDDRLKPIPEGYTHHIMISYCHKQRKKVAKIRKHLDKLGYKVWIDEEDMEGTLASSMAKGIINAAINGTT